MKTETLTSSVVALRNRLQPHFNDNVSPQLFDYDFFTQLESLSKKERERSKKKLLDMTEKPEDYNGTLIRTPHLIFTRSRSNAPRAFSLDLFIQQVADQFKIDKFKLKEIATSSVAEGTPRVSLKVEPNDD